MKGYLSDDISIVVCVADDTRIARLLDSISDRCEVVIVLNGATSEVRKIVGTHKNNPNFSLTVISIEDRNLSKARDIGTRIAHHEKVVHYDSDCIYVKGALPKYSEYLDQFLLVDGNVEFLTDTYQSKIVGYIRSLGIPGCALCPSIGINKKILQHIDYFFDTDIRWIEDADLNARAKAVGIDVGVISDVTCIHDNISFRQDVKSAFRYGTGARMAKRKGLIGLDGKKRTSPNANWNLIAPCFKHGLVCGLYYTVWNLAYCLGYAVS